MFTVDLEYYIYLSYVYPHTYSHESISQNICMYIQDYIYRTSSVVRARALGENKYAHVKQNFPRETARTHTFTHVCNSSTARVKSLLANIYIYRERARERERKTERTRRRRRRGGGIAVATTVTTVSRCPKYYRRTPAPAARSPNFISYAFRATRRVRVLIYL